MFAIELQSLVPKIDAEAISLGWGSEKICSKKDEYETTEALKIIKLKILNENSFTKFCSLANITKESHICAIGKNKGDHLYYVSKTPSKT